MIEHDKILVEFDKLEHNTRSPNLPVVRAIKMLVLSNARLEDTLKNADIQSRKLELSNYRLQWAMLILTTLATVVVIFPYLTYILRWLLDIVSEILKVPLLQNINIWLNILAALIAASVGVLINFAYNKLAEKEMLSRRLNPNIILQQVNLDYNIFKDKRCEMTNTRIIKAVRDGVVSFSSNLMPTILKGDTYELIKGGISSTVDLPRSTQYIIHFSPLKKGSEHRIITRHTTTHIFDFNYVFYSFVNVRDCKALQFTITFDKEVAPGDIYGYISDLSTNAIIREPIKLEVSDTTHHKKMVIWRLKQSDLDRRNRYLISWQAITRIKHARRSNK